MRTDIYHPLQRDIDETLNPVGMSVHNGRFTTRIDLVMRLLTERDSLQAELDAANAERERLRERVGAQDDYIAWLTGHYPDQSSEACLKILARCDASIAALDAEREEVVALESSLAWAGETLDQERERARALREALEPFQFHGIEHDGNDWHDDDDMPDDPMEAFEYVLAKCNDRDTLQIDVTVGDIRKARAALAATEDKTHGSG